MPRPQAKILHKTCARAECGKPFEVPDKVNYRERIYCSRPCSNAATAEKRAASIRATRGYQHPTCPCGKTVQPVTGMTYVYRKYCSDECRALYGLKRQPDPANYITFNCLNCGKEMTRYKGYGNGTNKYCSNECSAKHNRTKQHIVVEDAVVLDSPYEALFYGLCRLWKIPAERADRSQAVPVNGDGWYCPDFWLPQLQLHVETKGYQSDDDPARWAAWRAAGYRLAVVSREFLHVLRQLDGATAINRQLILWSQESC